MDSRENLVPSSETLSTTTPLETQWSQQVLISVVKEEIENDIDEENSLTSEYNMDECKPLQLSEYLNYYDSKIQVLEHVKKEFPVNEYSQTDYSKTIYEVMGLVNATKERVIEKYVDERVMNIIDKERVEDKNTEEALALNRNYEVKIKLERIDEEEVLENVEDTEQSGYTGVHYDVLVTPGEAHCKFCNKTFINSFNLLKHYNEHITIKINNPIQSNGTKKLHRSQYSLKRFNRHRDVHRRENPICELCGKQFKTLRNVKRHILQLHDFSMRATKDNLKCKYCNKDFINKYIFNNHMKLRHPNELNEEMIYQCDTCGGRYRSKQVLIVHIKKTHYDFGKKFTCWCGKQFRTPMHLSHHRNRQHGGKLKEHCEKFRCDHCKKLFNTKLTLVNHIKSVHYDYGAKVFECECGIEFQTPVHLANHKMREHSSPSDSIYNSKLQCDNCQKTFKQKHNLVMHIKKIHYDYGKVFKCWCGKEYRTPYYLKSHKSTSHNGNNDGTRTSTVQCDVCQKHYNSNTYLRRHRKRMH